MSDMVSFIVDAYFFFVCGCAVGMLYAHHIHMKEG